MLAVLVMGMLLWSPVVAQEATPPATPAVELPAQDALPAYEGTVENGVRTIVVVEHAVSDVVVDLEPTGDSMGDLLVFANPVYDEANETLVATNQGSCLRANPAGGVWECTWTLFLANGQIVVQGPFYDSGDPSMLAITGGAGAYAGAGGEMELSVVSATEFRFTYMIIEE
jgi:hypothetical protein